MCRRNRQQRSLIAGALLVGFQEYQSRKSRGLPPSTRDTRSFQEPMTQGVAYMAPQYTEPIDPNPPAYEEVTTDSQVPAIVDEKRLLYRLSTEEQVPPHASRDYNPNTGLDASVPRFIPPITAAPPLITLSPATTSNFTPITSTPITSASVHGSASLSHLLEAISLYFDTQIKLHADRPATVRKLEYKKARKLLKAEKKFNEHMVKGKDSKHNAKMEKRAEKMEKWTEWVLQKSVEHHEKHVMRHGRCCGSAAHNPMEQYRATVV